jgi:hypothetical protein
MSSILQIILQVFKAVYAYLRFKNISFYYDIREKHDKRKNELINEITKLRNVGDSKSTDAADRMFRVLEDENRKWESISAAYFSSASGNDSPD